ncbi:MAG: DUF2007 domain-containing protein [bacterium]
MYLYCPNCRGEYREGFTECADCFVPLVKNLPPEEPEPRIEYIDLIKIATCYNPGEVALVKSIFDANNIYYFIQGENFSLAYGHIMPIQVLVPKDKTKEAKELLKAIF